MPAKPILILMAGSLAATSALAADAARNRWGYPYPASLDAEITAPAVHRVHYEDDHVSILEVTLQPGVQEPMHGHKYPSVFAYDAIQPTRENAVLDGATEALPRTYVGAEFPTCRTMPIQGPHSLKITDTFPQHFYRLQFKQMEGQDIAALTRNHAR